MLDKTYYVNGHLTQLALLMLETGALTAQERELVLTHLSNCEECMQLYLDNLTEEALIEPPENLEQNILAGISNESKKKRQSKIITMQFVKLGIAVCMTMVLLVGGIFDFITFVPPTDNQPPKPQQKQHQFFNFSNQFMDGFNQFAYNFNNSIKGEKENESK